jgi:hypothetical protein
MNQRRRGLFAGTASRHLSFFLSAIAILHMPISSAIANAPADVPGISLTADELTLWDPNLFRLPDGADPRQFGEATSKRSDTLVVPSVLLDANFLPGRQRVHLSAKVDHEWLLNNPQFDVTDLAYAADWNWQLGNDFSGELADSQLQQLASFADYRLTQADRPTTRIRRASVRYGARPDRHVGVSFDEYVGSNNLGQLQVNDYRIGVARVEAGMSSGFGSEIVIRASATRGDYPNQPIFFFAPVDNSFRQTQGDISTRYVLGEKLQFDVLAGYAKRRYPVVSQRNFGAPVGHLLVKWEPAAKTQFELGVTRDLNAINDFNRIYTVSTGAQAAMRYAVTAKTQATIEAHATHVSYQGNPANFFTLSFGAAPYRVDRYQGFKFALAWTPRENLTVQLAQVLDARNSNTTGFQYRDSVTQLSLEYRIGPW